MNSTMFVRLGFSARCSFQAVSRSARSSNAKIIRDYSIRSALSFPQDCNALQKECRRENNVRTIRNFSDDSGSHSDFAPKKKATIENQDEALEMIAKHVKENPIMLYMKGNPSMPQCGFSAQVVNVMKAEGVDFASVNVLDYPQIREGVKKFSAWPTIPQLYVNGEFIGGCDIVVEMHKSGELKELLSEVPGEDKPSE